MAKPKFYQDVPSVPGGKIAGGQPHGKIALGSALPKMVPHEPGITRGLTGTGGFGKPPAGSSHGYGHPPSARVGGLRLSGHKGAHQIGAKAQKLSNTPIPAIPKIEKL